MRLFKNKMSSDLENQLIEAMSDFNNKFKLRDHLSENRKNTEKHTNIGLGIGAIGAVGVAGSIGFLALASPAIATAAVVGGVTVFGAGLIASGATVALGGLYAALSKVSGHIKNVNINLDSTREEKLENQLTNKLRSIIKKSSDFTFNDIDALKDIAKITDSKEHMKKVVKTYKDISDNKSKNTI